MNRYSLNKILAAILFMVVMALLSAPVEAVSVELDGTRTIESGSDCSLATYRFGTNTSYNGQQLDVLLTVTAEDNDLTSNCVTYDSGFIRVNIKDKDQNDNVAYVEFVLRLVEKGTNNVVDVDRVQITSLDLDSVNNTQYTDTDDMYFYSPDDSRIYLNANTKVTYHNGSYSAHSQDSLPAGVSAYNTWLEGRTDGNCNDSATSTDATCRAGAMFLNTSTLYFRVQNDNAWGTYGNDNYHRMFLISLDIEKLDAIFTNKDYGDAPSSYGAAGLPVSAKLGLGGGLPADEELAQQSGNEADGDDDAVSKAIFDDEDAVTVGGNDLSGAQLNPGDTYDLAVNTYNEPGESGYLSVWIDWNQDGDFSDAGERVLDNQQINASGLQTTTIPIQIPYTLAPGKLYLRFIYSSDLVSDSSGATGSNDSYGEVEDYAATITGHLISGRVFEDVAGDVLANGQSIGDNSNPPVGGAIVYLYDGGGSLLATTTTATDGSYHFAVNDGDYNVVVNSASIVPHAGYVDPNANADDAWAEQTYGPAGALCANPDGLFNSNDNPYERPNAGPCYGGRRGDRSDDPATLAGSEHVARVSVSGNDVTDLDFGFSFNVVTNTNDRDDDTNNDRTAQGSLRQFTQNANAIAGANAMRFVPAVSTNASAASGNWWRVVLDSNLNYLVISDDSTTVDGTAYSYEDGVTLRDANPGDGSRSAAAGDKKVGTGPDGIEGTGDEPNLPDFPRPELAVNGNDLDRIFSVRNNYQTIRGLALWGADIAIELDMNFDVKHALFEKNYIGPMASGEEPADIIDGGILYLRVVDDSGIVVQQNYFAYTDTKGGVRMLGNDITVQDNDFYEISMNDGGGDAIAVPNRDSSATSNVIYGKSAIIRRNRIEKIGGSGIDLFHAGDPNETLDVLIEENDIHDAGLVTTDQDNAIRAMVYNDAANGGRVVIRHNVIANLADTPTSTGVSVVGKWFANAQRWGDWPTGVTISQNAIYHNKGVGIDLERNVSSNYPAVSPNHGDYHCDPPTNRTATPPYVPNCDMNYPIFTKVDTAVSGGSTTLILEGYVGIASGTTYDGRTVVIEVFKADNSDADQNGDVEAGDGADWPHGEGRWYIGSSSVDLGSNGKFSLSLVVPANVSLQGGDYITATATDADTGSTSEFGANALVPAHVGGTIFEDMAGDSLTGGQSVGDSANPARPGVKVYAYRDDGDGDPDADDALVSEATTDANGRYWLTVDPNATYWVVVDSKSVSPAAGFNNNYGQTDVWAEQTYGAAGNWGGAICDVDADGSTVPEALTASGPCYGGRYGNHGDELPDAFSIGDPFPADAEHVAKVTVGTADVDGVDFGFSFNVVTNTNDGDDDTSANRTVQGSLRQFIQNANAIKEGNDMRFVPAVEANQSSGGGKWWRVTPDSALPTIVDGATSIDGTAYDHANPANERNDNPGSAGANLQTGSPGQVGCGVTPVDLPELEIANLNHIGTIANGLHVTGDGVVIRKIAIYGFGDGNDEPWRHNANIRIGELPADSNYHSDYSDNGSNFTVTDSLVGLTARGEDPAIDDDALQHGIFIAGADNGLVEHNLVAYNRQGGIKSDQQANDLQIIGNESFGNALKAPGQDGIDVMRSKDNTIRCNYSHGNGGMGIDTWGAEGGYTIEYNTVVGNGAGPTNNVAEGENGGLRIWGNDNLIAHNLVHDNQGAGLFVVSENQHAASGAPLRNKITQNSFYGNRKQNTSGLGIDLGDDGSSANGDGVTPNDGATDSGKPNNGIDYPVFTSVKLNQDDLELSGYIGDRTTGQFLSGSYTIEVFVANNDPADQNGAVELDAGGNGIGNKPHGEGASYLGSCTVTLQNGAFDCILQGVVAQLGNNSVTATATDANGNTSEFGPNALPGIPVSGRLFHDVEPNGARDATDPDITESDLDGANPPDLYVKLFKDADGDCSNGFDSPAAEVVEIDASGAYLFDAVEAGSYCLVLDDSSDADDGTPYDPTTAGWLYTSPRDGILQLTISERQVDDQVPSNNNDFALFHGSVVTGTLFRDAGQGSGNANDALQDGDEPGIPDVTVTLSDDQGHVRTAQTNADGHYSIYLPADWGSTTLSHDLRPASGYNTPDPNDPANPSVHQAADYADATAPNSSAAKITLGSADSLAGQTLDGYNLGVVYPSALRPDQNGTTTTPGAVTYTHTYQPGTQGEVTLSRSGGDYTYQIRVDANCDGDFEDADESWTSVTDTTATNPTFTVTDSWPRNPDGSFKACNVEVRVLVPDGEPEGAIDIARITASLTWDGNSSVIDPASVTDTTTIRILGGLTLEKKVRNITQGTGFDTRADGKPDDVLEYCISYTNAGANAITEVAIADPVPFFADLVIGAYDNGNADILWRDAGGTDHYLTADAADNDGGEVVDGLLTVHAEAALQPGAGGEVCYRVRIR